MEELQVVFAGVKNEVQSKANASMIEAALHSMNAKIEESTNRQSHLQRLAQTLGKDQDSAVAMRRLQIELEQVILH